jgi:hypothetical protein
MYVNYLQKNVDEAVLQWNTHRIRPTKNQNVPHGRPAVLYNMPNQFGTHDYLCHVSQNELENCASHFATDIYRHDSDYFMLCEYVMQEYGWIKPANIGEMCDLYAALREVIQQLLLT